MSEGRSIRKSILVRAPLLQIQEILTDREQVAAWWGSVPDHSDARDAANRPIWGLDDQTSITVVNNDLPNGLSLIWPVRSPADGAMVHTSCVFSLESRLDHRLGEPQETTLITVRHDGIPEHDRWDDIRQDFSNGWVTELVYLQLWAERGLTRARITDPTRFRTIERELEIACAPDQLFRAFTDPVLLGAWMGADVELEAKAGGAIRFRIHDGAHVGGEVVLFEDDQHIVWHLWDAAALERNDDPGMITVTTWHLVPMGAYTILHMIDAGYDRSIVDDTFLEHARTSWDERTSRIADVVARQGRDVGA